MRFSITTVLFLLPCFLSAQLSAPGAKSVRPTAYPSDPDIKDSVFIYCSGSGTQKGALNAISPGGTAPVDFEWYRWNEAEKSFSDLLKTDPGKVSSTISDLDAGGYRVIISGGYDTAMTGWIVFDQPPLAEAKLRNPMKHCNYVALDGTAAATVESFPYFDPGTGDKLELENELSFLWSSQPYSAIPYPDVDIDPITFSPPLEDVIYKLEVSTLGCTSEDTIDYKSIHVDADFTVDPVEGEAPLEVTITDKSTRGYIYEWDFGDDTVSNLKDPLPHTYYIPGEYTILLTIESEFHCIDSMRSEKIVVQRSALAIPNVFTPDGDGYNDRFMVESKSLRYISVDVFSRSGLKVYGFSGEGERLQEWTGWDGHINNSSIRAAPGVYFYIIRAYGWDDKRYDSKEYRGVVYLYR